MEHGPFDDVFPTAMVIFPANHIISLPESTRPPNFWTKKQAPWSKQRISGEKKKNL